MIQCCPKNLVMPVKDVRYRTWCVTDQLQAPGDTVPIELVITLAGLHIPYRVGKFSCNFVTKVIPSFILFLL